MAPQVPTNTRSGCLPLYRRGAHVLGCSSSTPALPPPTNPPQVGPPAESATSSSSKTPIIAGVTVGAAVLVALVLLGIFLVVRRRRRLRADVASITSEEKLPNIVDPFLTAQEPLVQPPVHPLSTSKPSVSFALLLFPSEPLQMPGLNQICSLLTNRVRSCLCMSSGYQRDDASISDAETPRSIHSQLTVYHTP